MSRGGLHVSASESFEGEPAGAFAPPLGPRFEARTHVLSNGLSVLVLERRHLPIVSVTALLDVGVHSQGPEESGLANFTAGVLLRGTAQRSAVELDERVDWLGASLGVHCDYDYTLLALSAIGLPLTAGFAGEFLLLLSLSKAGLWWALAGGMGVILGAVLYLQWIRRSLLGPEPSGVAAFKLRPTEAGALGILALGGIVLGVYPKPLLELARPSLDALLLVIGAR